MDFLAMNLSGIQVTERERSRRTADVSSATTAAGRAKAAEERAKNRQIARDKFLENSGVGYTGWLGTRFEKRHGEDGVYPIHSGGPLIGLQLGRYFSLETGFNIIGVRNIFDSGGVSDTVTSTLLQVPFLAKVPLIIHRGDISHSYFSPYTGIGVNFSPIGKLGDVEIQSLSPLSILAGADLGIVYQQFRLFLGFQYNSDINNNEILYKGENQVFKNLFLNVTFGIAYFIPFHK